MTLKAKYQTSDFVFTGNPVVLQSQETSADPLRGASFRIESEGKNIYEGRFHPPLDIDVSEILDSAFPYLAEPSGTDSGNPFELIEDVTQLGKQRRVTVYVDYGDREEQFVMTAIPGGISGQQYTSYALSGKDVFDGRFYGPGCNFFFTSRTSRWKIEMKETELYPLYFMAMGPSMRVLVTDVAYGKEMGFELPGGICTLDPDLLRRYFLEHTGHLCNVFDLYKETGRSATMEYACRLLITHCSPAKERYRLKFRNSFGVFEVMELTGKLMEGTEFEDLEASTYNRLDPVNRRYSNLRERLESKRILEITTPLPYGYGNMLRDLLGSEEVYILDAFKMPVRINVSMEAVNLQSRREIPEVITLKMEIAESELRYDEIDSGPPDSRKPRVHTREFNKKFN